MSRKLCIKDSKKTKKDTGPLHYCFIQQDTAYKKKEIWLFPFLNKPWFLRVCNRSLLKTLWEKKKLLVTSNFSIFHSVFYPFGELSAIFVKFEIVVCKVSSLEESKICCVGKG